MINLINSFQTNIPEFSGLVHYNSGFLAVSDLGNIYNLTSTGSSSDFNPELNRILSNITFYPDGSVLNYNIKTDFEGITVTPDGDIYACVEAAYGIDQSRVGLENIQGLPIVKIPKTGTNYEIVGNISGVMKEPNKGLEGITYYRTINGEPLFLIGNQSYPTVLMLWSKSLGIIAQTSNYISDELSGTHITIDKTKFTFSEIADLSYDSGYLYVLDSKTAKIHKCMLQIIGNTIKLTTEEIYDLSNYIDITDNVVEDGENPESLSVKANNIWIGCDNINLGRKLYNFKIMNEQIQRPSVDGNTVVRINPNLASGSHLGLADADDIAYSYKDENGIIKKDKTVRDKIDELIQKEINFDSIPADKVIFNDNDTLVILSTVLESLSDYVSESSENAAKAEDAFSNVQQQVSLADAKVTRINEASTLLDEIKTKYTNIEEVANNLLASLNINSPVRLISEQAYYQLSETEKNNGTIYLLYSDSEYYFIVGISNSPIMGEVTGSDNHAYAGKTVTLKAEPKTGYVLDYWTNSNVSGLITGETITINASENIVYQAFFKPKNS